MRTRKFNFTIKRFMCAASDKLLHKEKYFFSF